MPDLSQQGTWLVPSAEHRFCTRCGYTKDRHRLEVFCPGPLPETQPPADWVEVGVVHPGGSFEINQASYTMSRLKVGAKPTVTIAEDGTWTTATKPVIWCPCGAEVETTKSNFLPHLIEIAQQHLITEHGWVEGRG